MHLVQYSPPSYNLFIMTERLPPNCELFTFNLKAISILDEIW